MSVRKIEKLLVIDITVSDRLRPLNKEALENIKNSMAKIGLRTPITVRVNPKDEYQEPILVSGHHRLEAARQLGWDHIECFVSEDADEDRARMWEIAENLHRSELTTFERNKHRAEWIKLAEKILSSPVREKTSTGGRPESGVSMAGRELGLSSSAAERAMKIGEIPDAVGEKIVEAGLDTSQRALEAIARTPVEQQMHRVAELSAAKAIKAASDPVSDQQANERQVARLMDAWNAAGPDARQEFLLRIDQPIMDRRFG